MFTGYRRQYNLIIVGSNGIGKQAFIGQVALGVFIEGYDPTQDDYSRSVCTIDSEGAFLELIPISIDNTTESKHSWIENYLGNGSGILLFYSITSRASFDDTSSIHSRWCRSLPRPVTVLVGTKSDLENERQVSKEEGEALAKSLECGFAEVSSKTGVNVRETVYDAVSIIRNFDAEGVVSDQERMPAEPKSNELVVAGSSVSKKRNISGKIKTARNGKCIIL